MIPIHHGILPVGSGQEVEDALEVEPLPDVLLLVLVLPDAPLPDVPLLVLVFVPLSLLLDSLPELDEVMVEEEPLRESVR
ncbi:hypothetical protein ASG90_11070 [Nocardioides sp. Soil797]|nr:hypothetical protein ASG90_11070 [Nocardioides sp. Soil797]